jgi:hypothetical protein
LIRHPAVLEEDCRLADIDIATFTIGKRCRAAQVIVDRHMLKEPGAHALYIEGLEPHGDRSRAARPPALGAGRRLMHGMECGVKATTERPTRRANPDRWASNGG